jgi:hypothetical protein
MFQIIHIVLSYPVVTPLHTHTRTHAHTHIYRVIHEVLPPLTERIPRVI